MLDLQNIRKTYSTARGPITPLRGLNLRVDLGEFVAVRGPSGSGKTTLLLIAGGLLHPDEGKVLLHGQDLYALSTQARRELRARTIGFVFQQFHLLPYLSVLDNVLAATLAAPVPDARRRAEELLARLGLTERLHHVPGQLSTGERQRTALCRALLHRPKLILADEPTGNLDEENGRIVLDQLRAFAADGGGVLLVTHEAPAAERASRVITLGGG